MRRKDKRGGNEGEIKPNRETVLNFIYFTSLISIKKSVKSRLSSKLGEFAEKKNYF